MEEECILFGASDELLSASREVISCSAYLSVQITKISGYVQLLAGQSKIWTVGLLFLCML